MIRWLMLIAAWLFFGTASAQDLTLAKAACGTIKNLDARWECLAYVENDLAHCTKAYHDKFCKQAADEIRAKTHGRCDSLAKYATNEADQPEMERWCVALAKRKDTDCRGVVPDDAVRKRECESTVTALEELDKALLLFQQQGQSQEQEEEEDDDDASTTSSTRTVVRAPTTEDDLDEPDEDELEPAPDPLFVDIDSEPLPWRREVRLAAKELSDLVITKVKPFKAADRKTYVDMALGFTDTREQRPDDALQQRLAAALAEAKRQGDQALVDKLEELIALGNDKDASNLRLFGDSLKASSWMDWKQVDDEVAEDYSAWFEESAVKTLEESGGRFKFNLTGFKKAYMLNLKRIASRLPIEVINRAVNMLPEQVTVGTEQIEKLSKTDWEVIRILTDPDLFASTEWYAFDKLKDAAPVKLEGDDLKQWSVNAVVRSPRYDEWLVSVGAEDPLAVVETRMRTTLAVADLTDPVLAAWQAKARRSHKGFLGTADDFWNRIDGDQAVQDYRRAHPVVVQGGVPFDAADKTTWLDEAKREAVVLHGPIDWTSGAGMALVDQLEEYIDLFDDWSEMKNRRIREAVQDTRW